MVEVQRRNAGRDPTGGSVGGIQTAQGWARGPGGYEMPLGHGGVGGSSKAPLTGDAPAKRLRVMKRRNVSLVQKGSMPGCAKTERDATGERLASPLPRECCSTTHILRSFLSALFLHILS